MNLSSSSSVSSLRSSPGGNYHSRSRLAPIDESSKHEHRRTNTNGLRSSKYIKYQHQFREERKIFIVLLSIACLGILGLWHLFLRHDKNITFTSTLEASSSYSAHHLLLNDDIHTPPTHNTLIQSLRRSHSRQHTHAHAQQQIMQEQEKEQQHQHQHQQPQGDVLVADHRTREERLADAIQELQKYQADAEGRKDEYQDEVKAQLEDELEQIIGG